MGHCIIEFYFQPNQKNLRLGIVKFAYTGFSQIFRIYSYWLGFLRDFPRFSGDSHRAHRKNGKIPRFAGKSDRRF